MADISRAKRALIASDIAQFSVVLGGLEGSPLELVDDEGSTVLHYLAYLPLAEALATQCLDRVLSLFQRCFPDCSKSSFRAYANRQTSEDQKSALFLCTQNNKVSLALRLLELGADPSLPDFLGNTCLHTAAARNQVCLVYFYVKVCEVDLKARNSKGRTALHVAALEGADQAASVIIAWSRELDERDNEGMTVLHLAAFSQCYRVVRHLLMAGAKRSIRDNKNSTARDLAITRNNLELADMLKEPSCLSTLNPLHTPLQPSNNSNFNFVLYHVVFIVRYAVVVILILPWVELPLALAVLICFVVSLFLFETLSIMDPGYVTKQENRDFSYLYRKYNPDYVCAYCETKRNKSVRHCQHCNRCVKHFDHHCPWLHNCVGVRNIKLFFLFLCVNLVDFGLQLGIGLLVYFREEMRIGSLYARLLPRSTHWDAQIAGITVAAFSAFCLCLILPLWYVQFTNCLFNTTTYRRFANKKAVLPTEKHVDGFNLSSGSDTPSILQSLDDTELTFFNSNSLVKSLSSRDHIEVVQRPRGCGLLCGRKTKNGSERPLINR